MKGQVCRESRMELYWSIADVKNSLLKVELSANRRGVLGFVNERERRRSMDYINAFWIGGLICALCQILLDRTKLMPGRVMVLLVCSGAVLGALQLYQPFQEYAGAGASVPLLGFGNLLWKGVKEAVDTQGFIGIFMGGFKASAVGISAALIFGYLASLVFEPKMKK